MSQPGQRAGHAFISYVREDEARVDRLQRDLEAAGIPVWRDTRELWPGQDWKLKIRRAISSDALAFIACFSRASLSKASSYQNEELILAIDQLRRRSPDQPWLIPVRFDACQIPDLDLGAGRTLSSIQRADLFGDARDDQMARLISTIDQILGLDRRTVVPAVPARRPAGVLPRMAVYFPYIHFRDERWLKVAALYWPKMVRIVSAGYPTRNSRLVDVLTGELGFVVDVAPDSAAQAIAAPFGNLIRQAEPEVLERLAVAGHDAGEIGYHRLALPRPPADLDGADDTTPDSCIPVMEHYSPRWTLRDTAGVHDSEVAPELRSLLIDAGLAVPARGEWLAMNPALAWAYKVRLTEELARNNQLTPATDQTAAHAIVTGPVTIRALADLTEPQPPAASSPDIQTTFGLLAVRAIMPDGLDQIPPEKIAQIRTQFASQFDRWRRYTDAVGAELSAQLHDIESPDILRAYLNEAVRRYATGPLDDLRKGLTTIGVDAAPAAISTKFQLPTHLASTAAAEPHLATARDTAIGLLNLRPAFRRRAHARQRIPAAYLLNVHDTLAPGNWISHIMAIMRRAGGMDGSSQR